MAAILEEGLWALSLGPVQDTLNTDCSSTSCFI